MDKSAKQKSLGKTVEKLHVVKKERIDEDIKEFAETAMNELLGWYGYGGANHTKDQQKPAECKSRTNSNSSGPDSPKFTEGCGWCGKQVDDSNGLSSGSSTFCSELCFSQSRRANFKKNKTCDWCRHVRHTVSYVDFQDGASQLQFCSDKCLNQYKMHIFCRETRAHLEMHPHLIPDESTSGLITPDLWLKNCKSPASRSPSPQPQQQPSPQTSPLPLITLTHPSKLLASPPHKSPRIKRTRKRIPPSTITNFPKISESPQDLRVRHSPEPQDLNPPPLPFPPDPRFLHPPLFNHPNIIRPPPPNLLPPVTIMVPYPVMIPIPVPIPIPLPLASFVKAAELKNNNSSQNGSTEPSQNEVEVAEEEKEDEIVVDDVKEIRSSPATPIRPIRKRKRVVEAKSKIVLKTKKPLSV